MKNKALDENVTALCFLKAESFTSAISLSTLAKCSQVRETIRGQALNLKKHQPRLAFSPGLVLETAVCKRANGVAWFSCVGASLDPAGG